MYLTLGDRERQIMDALYRLGRASVSDVLAQIPDAPSYSTVRTMLGKLERKGHVRHVADGPRYLYLATVPRRSVQTTALRRILRNLFDNSAQRAVAAVLDLSTPLSEEELDEIEALIAKRRRTKRRRK
jgi:BlaI family transcriptional regulator, penicillinase repressor